jgi:hypothetical protein
MPKSSLYAPRHCNAVKKNSTILQDKEAYLYGTYEETTKL